MYEQDFTKAISKAQYGCCERSSSRTLHHPIIGAWQEWFCFTSERIVMGAIGAGGQGTRHIGGGIWVQGGGFLSKPYVQFVAVCDVNADDRNNACDIVNKFYGNKDSQLQ